MRETNDQPASIPGSSCRAGAERLLPARRSGRVIGALGDPNRRSGSWRCDTLSPKRRLGKFSAGGPSAVSFPGYAASSGHLAEGEHSLLVGLARKVGKAERFGEPIVQIHRSSDGPASCEFTFEAC
jgi:hypothetical protein